MLAVNREEYSPYMQPADFKVGTVFIRFNDIHSVRMRVVEVVDRTMVRVVYEKGEEQTVFSWRTNYNDSVKVSDPLPDGCLP